MIEDVFLYGKIENKKILTLTDQVRILKYIIKRGLLIIDGLSTMAMGNRMFKVVSWYDNEWGYSSRTVDLVDFVAKKMKVLEVNA